MHKPNDCVYCPLAWEERGYDDIDAGCHVCDDLYGDKFVCFLPAFIKNLILKRKIKQQTAYYDDFFDYSVQKEKELEALEEAIKEVLFEKYTLIDSLGEFIDRTNSPYFSDDVRRIKQRYEEILEEKTE